ncbi:MAG: hypothetical protein ACK57V_10835 [Pirellula sp.]|jgi:hypothetical protein
MESAAKKKNSLAMGVIGTMIVWASALLFSSAANASSASHVGLKSRAEVSGSFTAKSVEHLDANPINATRYYDVLEGVALECTVAPKGPNLNLDDAVSRFGLYEIKVNGALHKIGKADLNRITQSSVIASLRECHALPEQFGSKGR